MKAIKGILSLFGVEAASTKRANHTFKEDRSEFGPSMSCPVFLLMEDACMSAWVHRPSILSSLGDYESGMLAREMGYWKVE